MRQMVADAQLVVAGGMLDSEGHANVGHRLSWGTCFRGISCHFFSSTIRDIVDVSGLGIRTVESIIRIRIIVHIRSNSQANRKNGGSQPDEKQSHRYRLSSTEAYKRFLDLGAGHDSSRCLPHQTISTELNIQARCLSYFLEAPLSPLLQSKPIGRLPVLQRCWFVTTRQRRVEHAKHSGVFSPWKLAVMRRGQIRDVFMRSSDMRAQLPTTDHIKCELFAHWATTPKSRGKQRERAKCISIFTICNSGPNAEPRGEQMYSFLSKSAVMKFLLLAVYWGIS